MAYQPKSSRSSIVSNINISCKIIIHFNLLTHRVSAFLSVFEQDNKETVLGYPSPHLSGGHQSCLELNKEA